MNFGYKFRVKNSGAQSPSHPLLPLSCPLIPPLPPVLCFPPIPSLPPIAPLTPSSPTIPRLFPTALCLPPIPPLPPVLRSHFISRTISSIRVGAACSLRLRCQFFCVCLRPVFTEAFCAIPDGGAVGARDGVLLGHGRTLKGLTNDAQMCPVFRKSARGSRRARGGAGRSQQTKGNDEQRHRHYNVDLPRMKGGWFNPAAAAAVAGFPLSSPFFSPSTDSPLAWNMGR